MAHATCPICQRKVRQRSRADLPDLPEGADPMAVLDQAEAEMHEDNRRLMVGHFMGHTPKELADKLWSCQQRVKYLEQSESTLLTRLGRLQDSVREYDRLTARAVQILRGEED